MGIILDALTSTKAQIAYGIGSAVGLIASGFTYMASLDPVTSYASRCFSRISSCNCERNEETNGTLANIGLFMIPLTAANLLLVVSCHKAFKSCCYGNDTSRPTSLFEGLFRTSRRKIIALTVGGAWLLTNVMYALTLSTTFKMARCCVYQVTPTPNQCYPLKLKSILFPVATFLGYNLSMGLATLIDVTRVYKSIFRNREEITPVLASSD